MAACGRFVAATATGALGTGRRCLAASITGRCVATGAVATTADEQREDSQHDQDEGDDPEHLHPAWCAGSRFATGVVGVGGRGRISHVGVVLCRGWLSRDFLRRPVLQDTVSLSSAERLDPVVPYAQVVPKLWNETIEAHRREVRDAILEATATLVAEHGLRSVTMSQIAGETGIGRATLYKYFPGVEAILVAWHERQVTGHLEHLTEIGNRAGEPVERLEAVLEAYALITHERHGTELAALLHRGEHVARAQQQLNDFIRDLLTEGAENGDLRDDVAPEELASYCLHALAAASSLPSKAAVRRLVTVTVAGLRPAG